MKTIESILKHAEQIGKLPGQKQDQRNMNNIKIGMRLAIAECQKWIAVGSELPPISEKNPDYSVDLFIRENDEVPIVGYYNFSSDYWVCYHGYIEKPTHYRQIEIK